MWICYGLKHERKMNSGRKWKGVEREFTVTHTRGCMIHEEGN